jgi:hypothetical protein
MSASIQERPNCGAAANGSDGPQAVMHLVLRLKNGPGRFALPSAGNSSHNRILTTITQGINSSPEASFEAPLSDFDIRTLFVDVRLTRRVYLEELSEGK